LARMKIWWVFALVGGFWMVGACGGSSVEHREGSGASAGDAGEGGTSSGGSAAGGSTRGGANAGGAAARGGTDGAGGGVLDPCAGKECYERCSDCRPDDPACNPDAVARYCDAWGRCGPPPRCDVQPCETPTDCPPLDLECVTCDDGRAACATPACIGGVCGTTPPLCPPCEVDDDCPPPPPYCASCEDGTPSCQGVECHEGQCLTRWSGCLGIDPCEGLRCGEICNPCNGSDCPSLELPFTCNLEGECTNERPACGGRCETATDCTFTGSLTICGDDAWNMACTDGACEAVCDLRSHCGPERTCPPAVECRICSDGTCAEHACVNRAPFPGAEPSLRCDYVCPEP
jgi:hypothetical protein